MKGLTVQNQALTNIDNSLLEYLSALKTGHHPLMDVHTSRLYQDSSPSDILLEAAQTLSNVNIPDTLNDIVLGLLNITPNIDIEVLRAYKGPHKTNYLTFTGSIPATP